MAGTKAGGLKAAETNMRLHGADFYTRIGRRGGENGHTGGFYNNPELAKLAGRKGGKKSRRGPTEKTLFLLKNHKKEILDKVRGGYSFATIAHAYNTSPAVLLRWLAENTKDVEVSHDE